MAIFVLVPGSYCGGWYWKKITPLLTNHGHRVYTPTLTGLGERSHLVREDIDLNTHILDIMQVFEYEDLYDVILVGHSYGCVVIGGVAEKIPNRIRRLVYFDGSIPEDGKTAFDLLPGLEDIYKKRSLSNQGKEWLSQPLDPTVWGVTDMDDIAWINRRLSPMPWHTHDQPLRINNPEAKKIPKSYISCTEYSTEYKGLHFMAQKAKLQLGWDYHELKSGHLANVIVPNELVQILETLI